jgi:hypothetical protein
MNFPKLKTDVYIVKTEIKSKIINLLNKDYEISNYAAIGLKIRKIKPNNFLFGKNIIIS